MLEDVLEDPRPSWGVAYTAAVLATVVVGVLVKIAPEGADSPELWGFMIAVVAPTAAIAIKVAGGAGWWVSLRATAALVLTIGTGLAFSAVLEKTDNPVAYAGVGVVAVLVLGVSYRGRRETLPRLEAPAQGYPGSSYDPVDPDSPPPTYDDRAGWIDEALR